MCIIKVSSGAQTLPVHTLVTIQRLILLCE
jgi:hypothetical protein